MGDKLKSRKEIASITRELRKKRKSIVTTNGSFDLFHYGHLKTLKFAKKQGDVLIIGLNSDSSIQKYKSEKRPIIPQKERAAILESIEYVDYVTIFNESTPIKLLEIIKPNIHVKGSEYSDKIIERETVEKNNGKIVFIKRSPDDVSTSAIIKKITDLYR